MSTANNRQEGRTSQQMRDAAPGAIFVWCNGHLSYPRALARHLGRSDLRIESLSWAEGQQYMGLRKQIVIDHAASLPEFIHYDVSAINAVFGSGGVSP